MKVIVAFILFFIIVAISLAISKVRELEIQSSIAKEIIKHNISLEQCYISGREKPIWVKSCEETFKLYKTHE